MQKRESSTAVTGENANLQALGSTVASLTDAATAAVESTRYILQEISGTDSVQGLNEILNVWAMKPVAATTLNKNLLRDLQAEYQKFEKSCAEISATLCRLKFFSEGLNLELEELIETAKDLNKIRRQLPAKIIIEARDEIKKNWEAIKRGTVETDAQSNLVAAAYSNFLKPDPFHEIPDLAIINVLSELKGKAGKELHDLYKAGGPPAVKTFLFPFSAHSSLTTTSGVSNPECCSWQKKKSGIAPCCPKS